MTGGRFRVRSLPPFLLFLPSYSAPSDRNDLPADPDSCHASALPGYCPGYAMALLLCLAGGLVRILSRTPYLERGSLSTASD